MITNKEAFKQACIDENTLEQLECALLMGADEADMKSWGINEEEWEIAILEAMDDIITEQH